MPEDERAAEVWHAAAWRILSDKEVYSTSWLTLPEAGEEVCYVQPTSNAASSSAQGNVPLEVAAQGPAGETTDTSAKLAELIHREILGKEQPLRLEYEVQEELVVKIWKPLRRG